MHAFFWRLAAMLDTVHDVSTTKKHTHTQTRLTQLEGRFSRTQTHVCTCLRVHGVILGEAAHVRISTFDIRISRRRHIASVAAAEMARRSRPLQTVVVIVYSKYTQHVADYLDCVLYLVYMIYQAPRPRPKSSTLTESHKR